MSVLINIGGCHFVSFILYISGAKIEEHRSNISRDFHDSVLYPFLEQLKDVITFLICIIQKPKYL